jgi:hypothetical protein
VHSVGATWRNFHNSDDRPRFTRSLKEWQSYLDFMGFESRLAEVVSSVAMPWNVVALYEARAVFRPSSSSASRYLWNWKT